MAAGPSADIAALLDQDEYGAARDACLRVLATAEDADTLRSLATAELALGAVGAAAAALERAYRLHVAAGEAADAAVMASRLADIELTHTGAAAVATGWLDLARRHLRECTDPAAGVVVEMLAAYHALAYDKDMDVATAHAEAASAYAEAGDDTTAQLPALAIRGLAAVCAGEVDVGFRQLDEAAAAAMAQAAPPAVSLDVYCMLITACERVRSFDRVEQWARRVLATADRSGDDGFANFARTEYGNVLVWTGRWEEADATFDIVLEAPEENPLSAAMGLVYRCDLRRRQGRLEDADASLRAAEREPFRRAVRHLVLRARAALELARDEPRAALDVAARYLRLVPERDRVERLPALETTIRAAVALGELDVARGAATELCDTAEALGTDAVHGAALVGSGLLARATGDPTAAIERFEQAIERLDAAALPFEVLEARTELARTLLAAGDVASARDLLEVVSAEARERGAAGVVDEADGLLRQLRDEPDTGGFTPRELEVLRLLVAGASNAEIADQLVLSVRTVERHVSNIYLKVGVTGPTARTLTVAYAHEHALV